MGAATYLDLATRLGPDNKIAKIVELLGQTNEVLSDMITKEGNLPTGHRGVIRTGLPAVAWRLLNYGVATSKSKSAQITDACGMLEAYAEVDEALAKLNGNTSEFRLSEDVAFLEAMNQEMAKTLFYGNTAIYPERFLGLAPRYPNFQTTENNLLSNFNVVNAYASAADADQSSMWLVVWGENTVHGLYPKGSEVGFVHEDLGKVTLTDAVGGLYEGLRTHYKWDLGLHVKDWRYVVRICNIDRSAATAAGVVPILDAMIDAYYKIPAHGMGKAAFYAPSWVQSMLHKQVSKLTNVLQSTKDPAGRPINSFLDIPIRRCDQLVAESVITAV